MLINIPYPNIFPIANHSLSVGLTKLMSGTKKIVPSGCRAIIGQVAQGGITERPMLKARNAYHIFRVKRNCSPKVHGVAVNPVEHPLGGGNNQQILHASTVRCDAPPGQKVGLIADRRTGHIRGQAAAKEKAYIFYLLVCPR